MAQSRKAILETPYRRKRRRRLIIRRLILLGIVFCIVVAGLVSFFRMSALQVREIVVTGTKDLDPEVLRAEADELSSGSYLFFLPRRFVLWYPRKSIEAELLKRHSEASALHVMRRGLHKVEIRVIERTPHALYCSSSCFYADASGYIYQSADEMPSEYVVFRDNRADKQGEALGSHPFNTDTYLALEKFGKQLSTLNLHLSEIVLVSDSNTDVVTKEGRLMISTYESFDDQFEFLKTALAQPTFKNTDGSIKPFNYIDLRFGKKIFYKTGASETHSATSSE